MLARSPFKPKRSQRPEKPDRSAEFASVASYRPQAVMAVGLATEQHIEIQKESGFYSEAWRRAVSSLPCVLCGMHGSTQAAHRNEGKAAGRKLTDDCWTAALCTTCHGEIDQGKSFTRDERRQRIDLAILLTVRELARHGRLRIT